MPGAQALLYCSIDCLDISTHSIRCLCLLITA